MKSGIRKVISLVIALLLVIQTGLLSSFAVDYPGGFSESQVLAVIPKLDKAVNALLSTNSDTANLSSAIDSVLSSDETLNSVFSGIYGAMDSNDSSLKMLGINITPASLSAALSSYPDVSGKIAACSDMTQVLAAAKSFHWGASGRSGFASSLSAMLSPFNTVLYTVLCGGSIQLNALMRINGDNGYENAVVPLLKAAGCSNIMSQSNYSAEAKSDPSSMIKNIVNMLLSAVDSILAAPVTGICGTVPSIAYYLENGGLSNAVNTLIEPLSISIAGIFKFSGVSSLVDGAALLENSADISDLLNKIDLSSLTGGRSDLVLPEIKLEKLSECGENTASGFVPNKGAALITVLRYIVEFIKLNKTALSGGDSSFLDSLLSKGDDALISLIIKIFTMETAPLTNDYVWSYPEVTPVSVPLTKNLTREDYIKVLDGIDDIINQFIADSNPEATLEGTLKGMIYSNSVLGSVLKALYGALDTNELRGVMSLLGLDVTPSGVASQISGVSSSAASYLRSISSWEKFNPEKCSWGFYNGNADGFKNALTAALKPFLPVLSFALAGGEFNLFGVITIYGSDGYNSAVIPLLEALGCDGNNIKTYSQYVSGVGSSSVLTDIINPVFALIDKLCAMPVKTLCEILPNIVYFLSNGSIETCINNILYPLKNMLNEFEMGDILNSVSFSELSDFNLNSVISSLSLPIALPELDVNSFSGMGSAQTLSSKAFVSGSQTNRTYIVSDTPSVLISLLRYIVGALKMPENGDVLTGFFSSSESSDSPDMFSSFASNIAGKLGNMTVDEIIEWLYNLLFRETPKVQKPEDEEIPTIIYEKKDNTVQKIIIAVCVIIVLALLVLLFVLNRQGKFDAYKLKRRKKKLNKKQQKEEKKQLKLKKKNGKSVSKKDKKVKAPKIAEEKSSKDNKKPEVKKEAAVTAKPAQSQKKKEKIKAEQERQQELVKLKIRRDKAAKKALKNTKKADKYYAKALADANKKRK